MAKQSKDTQRGYFYTGAFPTAQQMKDVVDSQLGVLEAATDLPTASADNLGNEYKVGNVYYKCVLQEGNYIWQQTGNVVPSNDYTDIENKPKIGNVPLAGNLEIKQLGGIESALNKYQSANAVKQTDIAYIHDGTDWKKTTIAELRRPNSAQVTIAPSDWVDVGSGIYRASKSLSGITSDSFFIAGPAPESMTTYILTPYWLADVSSDTVVVECGMQINETVKLNVAYW